jgi:hypothetical protein
MHKCILAVLYTDRLFGWLFPHPKLMRTASFGHCCTLTDFVSSLNCAQWQPLAATDGLLRALDPWLKRWKLRRSPSHTVVEMISSSI